MAHPYTGGASISSRSPVEPAFSSAAKLRSRRYEAASSTSAVAALMSMMTGASTRMARANATP